MPSLLPALLAGGHCFGPLPDGASNVIVNTVWLHAASAPDRFAAAAADIDVDVVSLHHIKLGSFLGLTRVLLPDDAAGRYRDYRAAAVAARHPNCEAFAALAQSGVATSPAVTELLAGSSSGLLSTEDIERLSALLVPHSAPPLQACLAPESKLNLEREERIRSWHAWRRKLANMAIDHWNRTIGVRTSVSLSKHYSFFLRGLSKHYSHLHIYALYFLVGGATSNRHSYVCAKLLLQGTRATAQGCV
jgi:hypothetical protein